ncbi:MAG: thioesterase II family protein [Bacillota bacterium]
MRVRSQGAKPALTSSQWLFVPKPNPQARLRLFCFPYAGGIAEVYYSWIEDLPEDIELVAIQYPGHVLGADDKLYTRLSVMVRDLLEEISGFFDKRYAFFGHSMGAMVTCELTRYICEDGLKRPDYLFFSARNPPHLPIVHPLMHKMSTSEYIQVLRAFNVLPEEVVNNKELLQVILPVLKADFEMIETWQYNPYTPAYDIPVCTFAGVNDSLALPKNMLEWQKYTTKDFKIVTFPEKHYFILNKAVRKVLINNIIQCIR